MQWGDAALLRRGRAARVRAHTTVGYEVQRQRPQRRSPAAEKGKPSDEDDDSPGEAAPNGGKGGKGSDAKSGGAPPAAWAPAPVKARFEGVLEGLRRELAKLRSGRANPGMLAHIEVTAYEGQTLPLGKLAAVTARDAHVRANALAPVSVPARTVCSCTR